MNGLDNPPTTATWTGVEAVFDNAPIINPFDDNGINIHMNFLAQHMESLIRDLKQKNRNLSDLLTSMAHDIKTPITVLNGYIDEIDDGLITAEQLPHVLKHMKEEVKFLDELTVDMLAYITQAETLDADVAPVAQALSKAWIYEQEPGLTKYAEGDIAKLGNAMMYFRTRDLQYGRAVATPQGWRFERFESAADQERVARLFDSLRKQIRQGYFELPEALPPKGEAQS